MTATITRGELRAAIESVQRPPAPSVKVEAGDETWVTIGDGEPRLLVTDPPVLSTERENVNALAERVLETRRAGKSRRWRRALIGGPAGWTLTADDFAEIEANFDSTRGEGHAVDIDVLDRLRSVVGRPMVAATLSREGWRPRLVHVERLLALYVAAVEIGDRDAEMGRPDSDVVEALAVVRAMIDGDPAPENLVRLAASDVALIASWVDEPLGRCAGGEEMRTLLDRLRREVGA